MTSNILVYLLTNSVSPFGDEMQNIFSAILSFIFETFNLKNFFLILLGADLREIQKQIDHLDDRTDPDQVCTFLTLRRDVMFLEFDTAARHSMRDTFLATGNVPAYNVSICINKLF